MSDNKYHKLSKELPNKILNEFGVKIHDRGNGIRELETDGECHSEHVARLSGLMATQIKLFEFSLMLGMTLSGPESGIGAINNIREKMIELINDTANRTMESYFDNDIKTR